MNKMIKKMALALTVCGVLCTNALAAPKGGQPPKKNAKPAAEQRVEAKKPAKGPRPIGKQQSASKKHDIRRIETRESKYEVAHHDSRMSYEPIRCEPQRVAQPAPAPRREPPPPQHVAQPAPAPHREPPRQHHNGTLHTEDWCTIGASLVGGIVGGIIGSAL